MTMKEKKLFALGVSAGVLSAALVAGFLTAREMRPVSAASNTASPAASNRSDNGQAAQQGTAPGTMVELTPAEITAAGVQVAEVRTAALKTDIAAFGRVEQPEAQLAAVSARIGGRVDKLYVQYTGERVRRGQPVADIYSPEVATAIEEYHLAEENRNQLKQSDDAFARTQAAQAGALGDQREAVGCAGKSWRSSRHHLRLCFWDGCRSQGNARAICERGRHTVYRRRS